MRILILGAGPAGLFAAHAARERGHDVLVMSKPRKSFMHGAQYLHRPIPGYSVKSSFTIAYDLIGDIDGYRAKVYGNRDMRGRQVSPETLVGMHEAWDIREAYDAAWEDFGEEIFPLELRAGGMDVGKTIDWAKPDMTISTVPANLLCFEPTHMFAAERVWATDAAHLIRANDEDNVVLCSGDPEHPWYRQSRIHGWENTEYPEKTKPPVSKVWEVIKPLWNNCDCFPDVLRMGRYGLWEKGVLSDGAYYSTAETLDTLTLQGRQGRLL